MTMIRFLTALFVALIAYCAPAHALNCVGGTAASGNLIMADNGTPGCIPATALPTNIIGLSPLSYGAKCDGTTDDSTAITNWAAAIVSGTRAVLPNSSCIFKSPIAFPNVTYWTLEGVGEQSQLIYAGATTTGTIVTFGDMTNGYSGGGGCASKGMQLKNLRIMSNTVMTSGVGVAFGHVCEAEIQNFRAGADLDGANSNWYNAVQFYGGNTIHMRGYSFRGSNIAEIISGDGSNQFTDMYQTQGKISHSGVGLNIAGRVGGFVIEQTDILSNGTNVLIDQSQQATANTQIFFGGGVAIDVTSGGAGIGLNVNEAGGSNSLIFASGTWFASATNQCIVFVSGSTWVVNITGGTIFNCGADGLQNNSTLTKINITGTFIGANGFGTGAGYGINNTVSNNQVRANQIYPSNNKTGDLNGVTNYNYVNNWVTASDITINPNSGAGVVTAPIFTANTSASGNSAIRWHSGSAGTDQKDWDHISTTGGNFQIRAINEAISSSNTAMLITRGTSYGVSAIALSTGAAGSSTTGFNLDNTQHVRVGNTTIPTISSGSCGTGSNGTLRSGSNDHSGTVQIGAAATTTCTILFGSTWVTAPRSCVISPANSTAAAQGTTLAYSDPADISTTQFMIRGSVLASANFNYHCF